MLFRSTIAIEAPLLNYCTWLQYVVPADALFTRTRTEPTPSRYTIPAVLFATAVRQVWPGTPGMALFGLYSTMALAPVVTKNVPGPGWNTRCTTIVPPGVPDTEEPVAIVMVKLLVIILVVI